MRYSIKVDQTVMQFRLELAYLLVLDYFFGSSVCVMQWTGVIRDGTLIDKGI